MCHEMHINIAISIKFNILSTLYDLVTKMGKRSFLFKLTARISESEQINVDDPSSHNQMINIIITERYCYTTWNYTGENLLPIG